MPPTNYTDFDWIPVPAHYKEYLAAKINLIRQEIVAEGKVQVYLVQKTGDVATVTFKVPKAERMVNVVGILNVCYFIFNENLSFLLKFYLGKCKAISTLNEIYM